MDEDCIVETELPVKEKKLKQARLPFQILSESPKTGKSEKESPVTNKKRKLSSPSPLQNKSSKIIKITSKENETVDVKDNGNGPADISDDSEKNDADKKKARIADKKTEAKIETQSNLMTRFLVRTDKDTKKTAQENSQKSKRSEDDKVDKVEKVSDNDETKRYSSKGEDVKSKKDQDDVMVVDINEEADEQSSKADAEEDDGESPESDKKRIKSEVGSPESKFDESKDKDKEESDEKDISVNSSSDEEDESEVSQVEDLNMSSQLLTTPTSVTKKVVNSDRKKMTPKQLQKQLEKLKRQEERQKLKLEKEKKKEEEDKKKEMRRKEKEQKRKEKEEKQKEKEALEKKKEEERRKKKEAKEEEEKKKMEEKLEVERKKQKAASNFMGFFVAKKPETKNAEDKQANKFTNFMPFEVKTDMKIAPIIRRELSDEEKLKMDELRAKNDAEKSHLYLTELKSNDFVIRRSPKTFPLEMKDEDIVVIEEDDEVESVVESVVEKGSIPIEKHRPKLLYFHENRRPPYWGTWRKKSKTINPRRPYAKDNKWFDYEIDSDDEWEEEEPGESLHGSDDEKDKDEENNPEENEYDVDNEFMVPHGYLSDEEVREDEEEEEDMSPETQKFKLKVLGDEFEAERNEKTLKLKPKVIGCIWTNEHGTLPESTSRRIMQLLTARQAWVCETPININAAPDVDNRHASENLSSVPNSEEKSSRGAKKKEVPDEAIPHMIRLLHGNNNNRHDLAKEFIEFLKREKSSKQCVSKRSFFCKLRELANWMACPDEGPMFQKLCWYVSEDIRKQYLGDEKLEMPNKWTYVLTPKRRPELAHKEDTEEKKNFPLITQFAKNITHEEMKKQLQELKSTPSPGQQKPVKRATLISVPRGEQLPKSPRVSLLDKFVAAASKNNSASASKVTEGDVITIEDD